MVVEVRTIRDEVAAAMRYARKRSDLTTEQFARELNRLLPNYRLDERHVQDWENGGGTPSAAALVAAARIAELPVSTCLDEMEVYTATIPDLERRISALEDKVNSR